MEHFIYILISNRKTNWSYVGATIDTTERFKEHQNGKVRSTKGLRPLKLIHTEKFSTAEEARKRELYLKSGIGREEKNAIIKKFKA